MFLVFWGDYISTIWINMFYIFYESYANHSRTLFLELHLENAFQGANVKDSENKLFFIEFGQITHNQNIH